MVHIAGRAICVLDRFCRQRCAWCGEVLIDFDLQRIATIDGEGPGSWAEGAYVRVDGGASMLVQPPMPEDCCAVFEATRNGPHPKEGSNG